MHSPTRETTQSEPSQCLLPTDVRWCINNKSDLSLVSYVDHFTLVSKSYAVRRYKHIIKKHIKKDNQQRLLSELKVFKKTERYYQYWLDIKRRHVKLKAQYRCIKQVDALLKQEMNALLVTIREKSPTSINNHVDPPITIHGFDTGSPLTTDQPSPSDSSLQDPSSHHSNDRNGDEYGEIHSDDGCYTQDDSNG
ncbi:hypothetical protein K492DRAFT_237931 [Lichtheimia hyalospora FSU 10163]|nr:hypothetical protein K492DRAFT_237931 [Lichtheimia hyalospora FSU 10163]